MGKGLFPFERPGRHAVSAWGVVSFHFQPRKSVSICGFYCMDTAKCKLREHRNSRFDTRSLKDEPADSEQAEVKWRRLVVEEHGGQFANDARKLESVSRTGAGNQDLTEFRMPVQDEVLVRSVGVEAYG
jgi:hypothetical protein